MPTAAKHKKGDVVIVRVVLKENNMSTLTWAVNSVWFNRTKNAAVATSLPSVLAPAVSLWNKGDHVKLVKASFTLLSSEEKEKEAGDPSWRDDLNYGDKFWHSKRGVRLVFYGGQDSLPCLPGRCGGFDEKLRDQPWYNTIPPEIAKRGVDDTRWTKYMRELQGIQDGFASMCDLVRLLTCLVPVFWCLCPMVPISSMDPMQALVHNWLKKFNRDLLIPKGLYAKIFTFGKMTAEGKESVEEDDISLSALCIAFTPEEIARFKREPVLQQGHVKSEAWEEYNCWSSSCHENRSL